MKKRVNLNGVPTLFFEIYQAYSDPSLVLKNSKLVR
jgi:hypothetical protein